MIPNPGPRGVNLVVTADCNLRCDYCYQNAKSNRRMSWLTARRGMDLLLGSGESRLELGFVGGEALLVFPLVRRAIRYARSHTPAGATLHVSLVSNGTLIRDEHLQFLEDQDVFLELSFDGVEPAQAHRGEGTFRQLDSLLRALARERPGYFRRRVHVGITLAPDAVEYLAASVSYFLGLGLGEINIHPIVTASTSWEREAIGRLDEQFAEICESSRAHRHATGDTPVVLLRRGGGPRDVVRSGTALCSAPAGRMVAVDVDGRVLGCTTWTRVSQEIAAPLLDERLDRLDLGVLGDPELPARLRGLSDRARETGLFFGKENKHSSYGRCGECEFLAECRACPVSIGHIPGNEDPDRIPDFQCAFYLTALKWRDRFPPQPTTRELVLGLGQGPGRVCAEYDPPAEPGPAPPAA